MPFGLPGGRTRRRKSAETNRRSTWSRRTDNYPLWRGTRGAEGDRAGLFRKKNIDGNRQWKRNGSIQYEGYGCMCIGIRLHLRAKHTDGRGAAHFELRIGGMGGGTECAVNRSVLCAPMGDAAGAQRSRSAIRPILLLALLHGAARRAGMSVQALPGGSGYRRQQQEGHTQQPGNASSVVK